MGRPIRFYQSNHLRVIFFCIATGIPILVSAVSVYLWCVYEFTYTAKGKKAYGGKKNLKNCDKACGKHCCRKSLEGLYPQTLKQLHTTEVKPHYHELMDRLQCAGKENGDGCGTSWGYFSFSPRGSCSVCFNQWGAEAGADRMPTLHTVIKGWNMVQEEKRENESRGSKQKAEG